MQNTNCGGACPTCDAAAETAQMLNDKTTEQRNQAAENRPALPAGKLALIAAAALIFGLGLLFRHRLEDIPFAYMEYAVFLPAYFLAGGRVIRTAARNLVQGRVLDEYFLMTAASAGAVAIGELPEAVAVMLFFSVGELLEEGAVNRSRRSIAALMEVRPDYANLITGGRETAVQVDPESVKAGQLILVKPGEKIPLDGTVERGESFVDSAALTGESVPRRVEAGAPVLAGAVNSSGVLEVRVDREYGESSLAKIFKLVGEAAGRKAETEKFITRFAYYYTPAVVLAALGVAAIPPLLLGANFSDWLYRALVLLVISCPCALVISIPLGYFGGIGCASRHGILVKGANFLEALLKVKTVVFDKTGTLTRGNFQVTEVLPGPGFSEDTLLFWAAHAELYSGHPLARAIREAYRGALQPAEVGSYTENRGLGVTAVVRGQTVLAGSLLLLQRGGVDAAFCGAAGSAVYVAVGGQFAGCLVVRDQIKKDAPRAVRGLKEMGLTTVMLTGDGETAAADAAARTGVDRYYAGLLPEEKVERLESLMAAGSGKLAFIGDGINDAPALSRADVGMAMGALGTDAAIEAADVVIMDDSLPKVARAVQIAAFTRKVVVQNIVLALGVKGLFVIMGILGTASIWEAVFADVGVALLAIINATRVLRYNN